MKNVRTMSKTITPMDLGKGDTIILTDQKYKIKIENLCSEKELFSSFVATTEYPAKVYAESHYGIMISVWISNFLPILLWITHYLARCVTFGWSRFF